MYRAPALVLWDVDRTLVSVDGFGRDLLTEVFRQVTGRPATTLPDFGGRTDRDLVTALFAEHDVVASEDLVDRFFSAMATVASANREAMRRTGFALAGAAAAIEAFAGYPAVVQTVVTGNIRPTAEQKLTVFGLANRIDFDVGGYGSEDPGRAALVRAAWQRATRKYRRRFPADRVVVVGDTARDVAGARQAGVRSVGVATGGTAAAELAAAGADLVLPDLTGTRTLVEFIVLSRVWPG